MHSAQAAKISFPKLQRPKMPGLSGNKVTAYKNAQELASKVEIEKAGNGFITHTHYPSKGLVSAIHSNLHSVNTHLRSSLGSPKGNIRNA